MSSDDAGRIRKLLESFSGPGPLRQLFWTELEYDRAGDPLSTRGWPGEVRALLDEDPVLLARTGEGGRFHVVYCRMRSPALRLADERQLVNRLLPDHPWALFVFSDRAQEHWHLVDVKAAAPREGEPHPHAGGRRLFRRIAVSGDAPMRTAAERLDGIRVARLPRGSETPPLAIQQALDEAFDVEKVTREFYRRYREVFERVEREISGFEGDPERKRRFTQRLFNRLMFVAFVQKKGWLRFRDPAEDRGYLFALWEAYLRQRAEEPSARGDNFYRDRLLHLYREILNRDDEERTASATAITRALVGTGPYLNGGLFEEDELDRTFGVVVPDDAIYFILKDLFGSFNFTVTEASPLEVEVAVDPEMLGKIFEELVTGRHESGSYYTPKPIVAFMCREALKGYLRNAVPHEPANAVARFVDEHDAAGLRDGEAVLQALKEVKVCDPACGSGAYLLGMLHELLDLRAALFATRPLDTASAYERKLEIIQNNLYGVDRDDYAVETARLRLWLSLVVDFERGDDGWVPPLPNLKYKIEQGDSLAAPMERQYQLFDALVQESVALRAEHMHARVRERPALERRIEEAERQLSAWVHGGARVEGFDWAVKFPEVVAARRAPAAPDGGPGLSDAFAAGREGGFDIILANPPYVRHELIRAQKKTLAANFPDVYAGTADLYVYFYARALQLLVDGGMLVFISSNKWFRAGYGAKLRKHLGEQAHVLSITDFGDLPVFESAAAYPMIFVAEKRRGGERTGVTYAQPKSLDPPYPDVRAVLATTGKRLPPQAVQGSDWRLAEPGAAARGARMAASGEPLEAYVRGQIYYGVKTGLNDAFVIDAATRDALLRADPASAEIIKPLVMGKDIQRWHVRREPRWLIFARRGIDIDAWPAVREHLARWRAQLEPRPRDLPADRRWDGRKAGSYRWFELQDDVAYHTRFESPKIVFPDIARDVRFALDETGAYLGNTAYCIAVPDPFLLGVLNSSPVRGFYVEISAQLRGGYLRFIRQYGERIPIPRAGPRDRDAVGELALRCAADPASPHLSEWEAEIDDRVAALYGLTARERAA